MKGHNYSKCTKCDKLHEHPKGMLGKKHSEETIILFKKVHKENPSFLGRKHTDKTKKKISETKKQDKRPNPFLGKTHTKETKEKISIANKGNKVRLGRKHTEETKKKIGEKSKGRYFSKEARKKISKSLKGKRVGEKNPMWNGGTSFEPYTIEFTENLKKYIRKKDCFLCQICKRHQNSFKISLAVHHIDYDKKNTSLSNLVSLCRTCHNKTIVNREYWKKYFNNLRGDKNSCESRLKTSKTTETL